VSTTFDIYVFISTIFQFYRECQFYKLIKESRGYPKEKKL